MTTLPVLLVLAILADVAALVTLTIARQVLRDTKRKGQR